MKKRLLCNLCIIIIVATTIMIPLSESVVANEKNNLSLPYSWKALLSDSMKVNKNVWLNKEIGSKIVLNYDNNCIRMDIYEGLKHDILLFDGYKETINGRAVESIVASIANDNIITNSDSFQPMLAGSGVRYHFSDKPSLSGNFNVLADTIKIKNIAFNDEIKSYTVGTLVSLLAKLNPYLGAASFVLELKTLWDKYHIKNLSVNAKVYYSDKYPSGWYGGTFSSKVVATWYSKINYEGDSTTTSTYRNGVVI